MYLSDGRRRGSPDTPETGDDGERGVVPRELVHVADHDFGINVSVTSDGYQALRRVDSCA
jgi:hypothetical protein